MANEFKRMQKLAGIITESEYRESSLNEEKSLYADFDGGKDDIESRFARSISEVADLYRDVSSISIPNFFDEYEDGDDFYAGPKESLRFFKKLPNEFIVTSNLKELSLDEPERSFKITKTGPDSFKAEEVSTPSLNENKSKLYAMLADVADEFGKDSDFYSDLESAVVGWSDRNGELTPKGKLAVKNLLSNWDLLDDYGHFLEDDINEASEKSDWTVGEEIIGGKKHYFLYNQETGKRKGLYKSKEEAEQNINEGDTDYDRAKDAKRLGKKGEKNIYGAGVKKGEEIEKKKMKMSELKKAIKALAEGEDDLNINDDESLYDPVYEAKKDEEVEDIKDVDVTVGDEETTADVTTAEVDPNVKSVQDALTQAQVAAEKLGDDKLTDQIGNTITFFTRTHIVDKPGMTAESNIKERISKLVKSL